MLMLARLGLTIMMGGMKGSTRVREACKISVPSKIISSAMEMLTDILCALRLNSRSKVDISVKSFGSAK